MKYRFGTFGTKCAIVGNGMTFRMRAFNGRQANRFSDTDAQNLFFQNQIGLLVMFNSEKIGLLFEINRFTISSVLNLVMERFAALN